MTFLVDSDVLSEPTKPSPSPHAIQWLRSHELEVVVNPIIIGELEFGILKLPAGRRRTLLADWFEKSVSKLHVIPLDAMTARVWGRLLANLRRVGHPMPVRDSLIAATALQHDLTVATRNTRDYAEAGIAIINPFAE